MRGTRQLQCTAALAKQAYGGPYSASLSKLESGQSYSAVNTQFSSGARARIFSSCPRSRDGVRHFSGSKNDGGPESGVLGAINKKLKETIESDENLKQAFASDQQAGSRAASATEQTDDDRTQKPQCKSEPTDNSTSSSDANNGKSQQPAQPDRWYLMVEDLKDVLAVTFGMSRQRDIGKEVDMGLREYAWVTYDEPGTGRVLYRNTETGLVTEIQPGDWSQRSKVSSKLSVNTEASSLAIVTEVKSPWDRTLESLYNTPIIQGAMAVGEAVKASPVGQAVAKVAAKVDDAREAALEKWETSQHPLVVNSSYMVDSLISETDHGRALRQLRALDSGFDEYSFLSDMRDEYLPALARAFFKLDMLHLRKHCRETALAQMKAVQAARDVEGLTHDGQVLAVSKVEVLQARTLDAVEGGGTLPIVVVSAQVQYIHCVRNKKKEIVEGSESEIRAAVFVIALTREVDPNTGNLVWKTVEVAMHGSQLYL